MVNFDTSSRLAADLAGNVDPNEMSKVLAYLRAKRDGRAVFDYLNAINQNGRAVIRSNQTLEYYRNMRTAFERHLRPLQDDYQTMAETLGWAIRLLRYYRAVPDFQPSYTSDQPVSVQEQARPPQPTLAVPEVGDTVSGNIRSLVKDGYAEVSIIRAPANVIGILKPGDARKQRSGGIRATVERIVKNGDQILLLLKRI